MGSVLLRVRRQGDSGGVRRGARRQPEDRLVHAHAHRGMLKREGAVRPVAGRVVQGDEAFLPDELTRATTRGAPISSRRAPRGSANNRFPRGTRASGAPGATGRRLSMLLALV